jgi:hypothetical protein
VSDYLTRRELKNELDRRERLRAMQWDRAMEALDQKLMNLAGVVSALADQTTKLAKNKHRRNRP